MKRIVLLFLLLPLGLFSQSSEVGNWWIYLGDKKINSRFNWHHEVQYRNYDFIGDLEQLLLRTGLGYNFSPQNNNLLLGYGFIQSEPYERDTQEKFRVDEHRIYQQFIHKNSVLNAALQHRLRFEQRFIEQEFKTRFRYFLAINIPLNSKGLVEDSFYLSGYNEVFLNTTSEINFDRNRIFAGLGYRFSKYIRSEIGVMNQSTSTTGRNQLNLITFVNL